MSTIKKYNRITIVCRPRVTDNYGLPFVCKPLVSIPLMLLPFFSEQ